MGGCGLRGCTRFGGGRGVWDGCSSMVGVVKWRHLGVTTIGTYGKSSGWTTGTGGDDVLNEEYLKRVIGSSKQCNKTIRSSFCEVQSVF